MDALCAGLPTGRLALHDHGAQPLGGGVDGGGQPGRAARRRCRGRRAAAGHGCAGRAQRRGRRVDGDRRTSPSGTNTSGRSSSLRLGQRLQPLALGVPVDVDPAVGDVVAGEEGLDLVAALRPAVADHPHVPGLLGVRPLPVAEQVVDDGVQPLGRRVPRLEQVVVQTDVVDRLDGDVGVGVGGEQEQLGVRGVLPRPAGASRSRSCRASAGRWRSARPAAAAGPVRPARPGPARRRTRATIR